jgi:hypothetical protein
MTVQAAAAPVGTGTIPPQSLAKGASGNALLRVERALAGTGTWRDAHAAITAAVAGPVDASPRACL